MRLTDNGAVNMGARLYSPSLGRFLSVDPIKGGCANDYMYVRGDPSFETDTSGQGACAFGHNPNGSCRGSRAVRGLFCPGKVAVSYANFFDPSLGSALYDLGAFTSLAGGLTFYIGGGTVMGSSLGLPASTVLIASGAGLAVLGVGIAIGGIVVLINQVC